VFWKLIAGAIVLDQLLEGDIPNSIGTDGYSSYTGAGRVQDLLITLFAASSCLLQLINNPRGFPTAPNALLEALAGSQALYLGGKAQAMLPGRSRDFLKWEAT
jgi:hypothetical protein